MKKTISFLIAEGEQSYGEHLEMIIKKKMGEDTPIVQANNGRDAIMFLQQREIDILITDIYINPINGMELARFAKDRYPRIKVFGITRLLSIENITILRAFDVDAIIYKSKKMTNLDLNSAIDYTLAGGKFYSHEVSEHMSGIHKPAYSMPEDQLDDIDKKILNGLMEGLKAKEIADKLKISDRTNQRKLDRMKLVFNAKTTYELIAIVIKMRLV